jgi:hypothetical protein
MRPRAIKFGGPGKYKVILVKSGVIWLIASDRSVPRFRGNYVAGSILQYFRRLSLLGFY